MICFDGTVFVGHCGACELRIEKIRGLELQLIELADIGFGDLLDVVSTGMPVDIRHQQEDEDDDFFHDDCLPVLKIDTQNDLFSRYRFTPTQSWQVAFH